MAPHPSKIEISNLYNRVAPQYGQIGPAIFVHFGRRLAELTGITEGSSVLDVATGRGAALFPVSEIVGVSGLVVGIDLAGAMVKETLTELNQMSVQNATVLHMDAERFAFRDGTFDHLLCSFAIFFFSQPEYIFSEWYRVLRPGGKVGISVAGSGDESWRWYEELLIEYHHTHHFALSPGGSGLREPEAIKAALTKANFVNSQVIVEEYEFIYPTEKEWWDAKWTHGARYPLEQMAPEILNQFKAEVFARLAVVKQPDGFREKWRLICIIGTKPLE